MERDLKRILAYSTVEHVGIITLGLGSAMMLSAGEHRAGAALHLGKVRGTLTPARLAWTLLRSKVDRLLASR